jgi:small subunit ribosomal protein S16
MLIIRFSRVGKKNKAQFKIMLQEHTFAPGGKHVEILGSYDPHKKIAVLKEERIKYWLSKGAKASDTVHNLLVSKNIISDRKKVVKIPQKSVAQLTDGEEVKAEEAKAEDKKLEEKKEVKTEKAEKDDKKGEAEKSK